MNILILEDEIPSYKKLLNHLEKHFQDTFSYDWARSMAEGKEFLQQNGQYDLILADIELLDGTSFELFKKVTITCPIIFCSSFDKYLFEAFQSNGIAYLLKPYTQEEFTGAFTKYKVLFKEAAYKNIDNSTINHLSELLKGTSKNYKNRFVIKNAQGIYLLDITDISLIKAEGSFCKAIDYNGKAHILSKSISEIVEVLNPEKYFKINRSQIVNIDFIESMENHFKNRLLLHIKGTEDKALTSSHVTPRFREWLESQ